MRTTSLRNREILVTGASGFIGGHLCRRLLVAGARVHGLSRRPQPAVEGMTWWRGDLADLGSVRGILKECAPEYIYHLAGFVSGRREVEAVPPSLNDGLVATVNLLVATAEGSCERIILAGSMEEPDDGGTPCSPYAAAKWAGAGYAKMFHALYALPVVTARMFMVYGPGQKDLKKLVPYVILSLLRGESPRLSEGKRPVDWIYVEDVVEGLIRMGEADGINGSTLELGTGRLTTVREVVEKIYRLTKTDLSPSFGTLPDRPMERVRRAKTEETMEVLGWRARTELEEGLRQTVDWYTQRYPMGRTRLER